MFSLRVFRRYGCMTSELLERHGNSGIPNDAPIEQRPGDGYQTAKGPSVKRTTPQTNAKLKRHERQDGHCHINKLACALHTKIDQSSVSSCIRQSDIHKSTIDTQSPHSQSICCRVTFQTFTMCAFSACQSCVK